MLEENKKQILNQLIISLSREEIIWASGYLAGTTLNSPSLITANNSAPLNKEIAVIYVTETGNSKFLASEIAKKLKEKGSKIKLKSAEQYRPSDLAKEQNLILIVSTHGEGEIPQNGKKLFEYLSTTPDLKAVNYLIIALGDKNYPLFCEAGKIFDQNLQKLGAQKIGKNIELNIDFEDQISEIHQQVFKVFGGANNSDANNSVKAIAENKHPKNEYVGEIISNINLNDIGSSKETRHIEIAVDGGIDYQPGDSAGILFSSAELGITEKVSPRLYSAASSPNEHNNELHLTVAVARHIDENGKPGEGLFSGRLSRLDVGQKIKFYISRNRSFKLPDDNRDIIMIGAGTGVAPFRAFLAERNYRSASGKNWLFFGERNFGSDFLYQVEWQEYLASGLLTKIDVAFSRDGAEKIYVQDRLIENASQIFKWLESGAYFYICGAKKMAADVEQALLKIITDIGNKTGDQATEWLGDLSEEGRYLKDIY